MALYSVGTETGGTPQVMTTTYKTITALTAATGATTLRKAWVYDFTVGTNAAPGDTSLTVVWDRQTTVGTATTAVPIPLDSGDAASLVTARVNHTVEPTVTANTNLLAIGLHQRNTYRWQAFDQSRCLVVPATDVAGIGLRAKSLAYTGTMVSTVHFVE